LRQAVEKPNKRVEKLKIEIVPLGSMLVIGFLETNSIFTCVSWEHVECELV